MSNFITGNEQLYIPTDYTYMPDRIPGVYTENLSILAELLGLVLKGGIEVEVTGNTVDGKASYPTYEELLYHRYASLNNNNYNASPEGTSAMFEIGTTYPQALEEVLRSTGEVTKLMREMEETGNKNHIYFGPAYGPLRSKQGDMVPNPAPGADALFAELQQTLSDPSPEEWFDAIKTHPKFLAKTKHEQYLTLIVEYLNKAGLGINAMTNAVQLTISCHDNEQTLHYRQALCNYYHALYHSKKRKNHGGTSTPERTKRWGQVLASRRHPNYNRFIGKDFADFRSYTTPTPTKIASNYLEHIQNTHFDGNHIGGSIVIDQNPVSLKQKEGGVFVIELRWGDYGKDYRNTPAIVGELIKFLYNATQSDFYTKTPVQSLRRIA